MAERQPRSVTRGEESRCLSLPLWRIGKVKNKRKWIPRHLISNFTILSYTLLYLSPFLCSSIISSLSVFISMSALLFYFLSISSPPPPHRRTLIFLLFSLLFVCICLYFSTYFFLLFSVQLLPPSQTRTQCFTFDYFHIVSHSPLSVFSSFFITFFLCVFCLYFFQLLFFYFFLNLDPPLTPTLIFVFFFSLCFFFIFFLFLCSLCVLSLSQTQLFLPFFFLHLIYL